MRLENHCFLQLALQRKDDGFALSSKADFTGSFRGYKFIMPLQLLIAEGINN